MQIETKRMNLLVRGEAIDVFFWGRGAGFAIVVIISNQPSALGPCVQKKNDGQHCTDTADSHFYCMVQYSAFRVSGGIIIFRSRNTSLPSMIMSM
jgi:hypothetical protein